MSDKVENQINRGMEAGGKTHGFNNTHDPSLPIQTWFQNSEEGLVLFVVFYTQACRWAQCSGCNLASKGSHEYICYKSLVKQIDYVFSDPEVVQRREEIRKVIVSNNGSVLDQETFSTTALMYLMVKLNLTLPNLAILSMETRPEYVDLCELEILKRALAEGDTPTELEFAIGFEAFNDKIRNDHFKKGLELDKFERFVKKISKYKYRLKCYLMQKPVPGMTDEDAVIDIFDAINYLDEMSCKYDVPIGMHLNPTYVAYGTVLEESFSKGDYEPPLLKHVARAAYGAKDTLVSVFIGLFDEDLAVEGGSFIRPGDEVMVEQMEAFNITQDFVILEKIINT